MVGILKKLFKKEKITKKYKDGDIYIGEMKNDEHHGQGTYTWTDGSKYVGEWKDDEKHGQGTFTWGDGEFAGDKYVGEFLKGKRRGLGTYTYANGGKYVGEFKDDEKHGQGTLTFADGDKYVGKWKDDKRNGQGTETYASGDKYVGEWKDNKRHGQGTYTFADGDKYVGEWEGDEQCEGTITSADGKVEKITKTIKRNELAIFEELRLKQPTNARTPEHYPEEYSLRKLNILCRVDKNNTPISWWKKMKDGKLEQVAQLGGPMYSGDENKEKTIPKESSLKKNKSKILVTVNKNKIPVTWWTKDKNGELLQLNIKEEEGGIEFKIKSWLRNKAIDAVGLEIRSMKNKAYEYPKDELMRMIEKEENKMIKKGGWKALRVAALSTLGLSWLPFL